MTHRTTPKNIAGWWFAPAGSLRWLRGISGEIAKEMKIDRERVTFAPCEAGTVHVRIARGTGSECLAFLHAIEEDMPMGISIAVTS